MLRQCAFRGRSKIRDYWSPVTYQVTQVPKEPGSVYTIAPVDDLAKIRRVNRSLLKPLVPFASPEPVVEPVVVDTVVTSDSEDTSTGVVVEGQRGSVVRRSTRTTAGQHRNPHKLPQSTCK